MTLIAAERPLTHGNTHGQHRGEETAFKPCRALVPHRRGGSHHARPGKGRTIRDAPRRRRARLGPGQQQPVLPRSCASSAAGMGDAAWCWAVLRNHRLQPCSRHAPAPCPQLHHPHPTSDPLAIFIDAITATRMPGPGAACPHYLLSNRLQETTSQLSLPLLKLVRNIQDRRHNLLRAFNSLILSWRYIIDIKTLQRIFIRISTSTPNT